MKKIKIFNKDCRNLSSFIKDKIDFIVFSPPYWNLREYKSVNQLGHNHSYIEYLQAMKRTFEECFQVLRDERFMAINIGTVVSNEGMKFVCGDFVKLCIESGFTFRKDIIWHKPKGTTKWQRGATQFTQNPYPLNYNTNINHEFILIFQKGMSTKNIKKTKPFNKIFTRDMAYSVWDIIPINSPKLDEKHVAPYPEEIPSRLIKLYTYKNEIVLDPFAGSGTTCKVAYELGRRSIAVELSKSYCNLIEKKIKNLKFDSYDDSAIYSDNADLYLDKIEKKIIKNQNELKKLLLERKKFYINNPKKNIKKQLKLFD
jgi:site-specific DNA-methyltransferase (adenine-specific)